MVGKGSETAYRMGNLSASLRDRVLLASLTEPLTGFGPPGDAHIARPVAMTMSPFRPTGLQATLGAAQPAHGSYGSGVMHPIRPPSTAVQGRTDPTLWR